MTHSALRRYVKNQKLGIDEERNPNEVILKGYASSFELLRGSEPDPQRLTCLRALAFDVFGADGAVFDQPDRSSFTLSNERFITRDPSDVRTGLFLARLLTADPKDRTDTADCIRDLLHSEGDAWTTLALPFLQFGQVREEPEGEEIASRAAKGEHLFASSNGYLASATLRTLRDAYDRLARFEWTTDSKLFLVGQNGNQEHRARRSSLACLMEPLCLCETPAVRHFAPLETLSRGLSACAFVNMSWRNMDRM